MKEAVTSGIRRRYLLLSLSILFLLTAAGAGAFVYMKHSQEELMSKREALYDKQVKLETLRDSLNDMFFRARGYVAFQNNEELEQVYVDIEQVNEALTELKNIHLNMEEKQLTQQLTEFMAAYENESLPALIEMVERDDYEGLREFSSSGLTDSVNQFVAYAKQYKTDIDDDLEALSEEMLQQANQFTLMMIVFIFLLFLFITYLIWRMMKEIVRPLEHMRKAADDFASGKSFSLLPVDRNDEIGVLFSSFGSMIRTIQEKEEELMAQNEELIMQQEELQEHQIKIEDSLCETRQTKERLERYNELNHVLSFSLDKQELADSVLEYLDKVYQLDLGLFWLRDSGEYALKGVTKALFDEFSKSRIKYIDQRLKEDSFFTVKREAVQEKGLASETVYIHEYFAGVRNQDGQMTALFGGARIGHPFSSEEQKDLLGLVNRISLAIERIQLYERNVKERVLNEQIVNNINEGIQLVGTDGMMLQRNEALCSILNCGNVPLDAAVEKGQWIDQLASQTDDPPKMRGFLENCISKYEHGVYEYRYRVLEPSERVIDVYSAPVLIDGEKTGTIFVHRDITKEYEVDQMKTELVSTVSHELRTPLSSVLGFTELLLHKQLKPEKQKKYLETIYKEAKRLTNLINDFLDLQRMEAGSQVYQIEELQINEIAVEAVARFRSESSHPIVVVDEATDVRIEGDKERLAQVLTNIIGNAIKFSPDGGHVTLNLSNEENQVVVSIRDEGIGIPAEAVPKLFNKFQRIDNSARRKIGGTGLGLAICREIIEKHNGMITIESEEEKGTTVRFSLPLLSSGTGGMAREEGKENSPSVMIVEDDMSLALLLSEELKMNGFTVIYHLNPSEAFEEAKRTPLVGVVIDIMLGDDLNGWDLVGLLKEEKETRNIPIIISSALNQTEEAEKLSQIDHYLTKPYPPNELSKAILGFLTEPMQQGVIFYPEKGSGQNESK
ncbi:ATP-binding protein [Domibacillus iocasae]|uniref:histidine kinase n=1 Tax=Domibacillus iocasae TaxID=1714016 RepID=A0A1E7DUK8_9BACI|nr:ATP-binding protein [Domibacillus iocasae]OES46705.1 histidine kinase [Domibacillus iocasae]